MGAQAGDAKAEKFRSFSSPLPSPARRAHPEPVSLSLSLRCTPCLSAVTPGITGFTRLLAGLSRKRELAGTAAAASVSLDQLAACFRCVESERVTDRKWCPVRVGGAWLPSLFELRRRVCVRARVCVCVYMRVLHLQCVHALLAPPLLRYRESECGSSACGSRCPVL